MMHPRSFKNPFSEELNDCNENRENGISITIKRFEQFVFTIIEKIQSDNQIIEEAIKKEDLNINYSPDEMESSLYFFTDSMLKSFLISIYSFFEYKLGEIAIICERHIENIKGIKHFGKKDKVKPTPSEIEKYNSYLKSEIINDLTQKDTDFKKILEWKEIRRLIVHNKLIDEKIKGIIKNIPTIELENNTFKFKGEQDILIFIKLVGDYLENIISLINEKYNLISYGGK